MDRARQVGVAVPCGKSPVELVAGGRGEGISLRASTSPGRGRPAEPAPQGWSGPDEWAGPPDPVLDSGVWEVVDGGAPSIRLRSGSDPRTGLRIERAFTLTGGGLEERITFRNEGDRTTTWSPWEV